MNRATWNNFIGKNFDNNYYAMEALARLLFRTRYGIGDSLPYFKNHAGNETDPINVNGEIIGFQSKYFDDGKIDADKILHSLETACKKYPTQNRYIIYTNAAFGNPKKGKDKPVGLERVEQTAADNNITLEWIYGDNILDLVQTNELAYNIFFNPQSQIHHIQEHIDEHNDIELKSINTGFKFGSEVISFDRSRYIYKISECIANNKSILVSGESGSGKSAIVKSFCEQISDNNDYALFVLNASSLAVDTVNDIFNLQDRYTLANFSSYFDGFTKKIIVIDSAEKLLDIDNSSPARLFIDHLKSKEWLFILTCKENSVSAITDRLTVEYSLTFEAINVPAEDESYIEKFAKEHKIALPLDSKLLREIRLPFYFARYSEISQLGEVNAVTLREKVWMQKVAGQGNRASQIKRELCMLDIVKKLLDRGTFVIPYENVDIESASSLVSADVLGEYPHKGFFVKHDIYTDWALDMMIKKQFEGTSDYAGILAGDSSIQYINAFKRFFLNDLNTIQQYKSLTSLPFVKTTSERWNKAIYECIGKSNSYAGEWFCNNSENLKANNYQCLNDFIETLVVSCQYVEQYFTYEGKDYPLMKPTGSGWESAVDFVWKNVDKYYLDNLQSVQKLISNYSRIKKFNPSIMHQAGLLGLRIFDIMADFRKKGDSFWFGGGEDKWAELVCRYGVVLKEELKDRFNQVITNEWTSHNSPYEELMDYILKKAKSFTLLPVCLFCKKEMLDLLTLFWTESPEKKDRNDYMDSYRMGSSDYAFGLNLDFEGVGAYFPSSAYQTPVYTLLQTENMLVSKDNSVLKFIIDFVDSRVDVFKSRGFANTTIDTIEVNLRNGEKHEVVISECLWNLYRGTSGLAMPHMMESVHMAMERRLLELAEKKENKQFVDEALWYILENAHSCSLYSIVASVASAHIADYFDQLLFLMQDVNFLTMDLMRHTREFHASSMEFAYYGHKDLLKERRESNALKHRNEHLEQLLLKMQILLEKSDKSELQKRVYDTVDRLKTQVSKMDDNEKSLAKYVILRIDARSMKQTEVQTAEGIKGIEYTPVLTPEMEKEQEHMEKNNQEMMKWVGLRLWIDCRYKHDFAGASKYQYDDNVEQVLGFIRDIRSQLNQKEGGFSLLMGDQYLPFMASSILLMQFEAQLNSEEKNECLQYVKEALSNPRFLLDSSLSGLEMCLEAIPCIMDDKASEKEAADYLVIYSLIKRDNYSFRPCDKIYAVVKNASLWEKKPEVMEMALEKFKETIPVDDFTSMNHEQAESLLCLLTSSTPKRDLGLLCIEKMSEYWKPKDRHDYSRIVGNFDAAYLIADYLLEAPSQEVKSLVRTYKPYINGDLSHDNLVSSLVLKCAQNGKYEIFWIVWDELYDSMVNDTHFYYNSSTLNSYLINPDYLREDAGDWFRLEKRDIEHFMRIAKDMASHPSVIYSISKVFATIGKHLQIEILPVLNVIVKADINHFEDALKTNTIYYMDEIADSVFPIYLDKRKNNPELNSYMVAILEFMQKHGSNKATTLLNQI